MSKIIPAQHEIWLIDLNPSAGSEPGKIRPAVVMQTDVLNRLGHNTYIICAISSQPRQGVSMIRVAVKPTASNGLLKESYILCDQLRSVDVSRLKGKIGMLDKDTVSRINDSIKAILSL